MTLIDTHVHVWDPRELTYPWLTNVPTLKRPLLPADYRSGSPATAHIFVEADVSPAQRVQELAWVHSLDWPELIGIVPAIDLDPANVQMPESVDWVAQLQHDELVVGVRHNWQSHDSLDPYVAGLRRVAAADLTFDVCIDHSQLSQAVAALDQVPTLRFVLDHLGKPPVDAGLTSQAGQAWLTHIREISHLPGGFVKLSGLAAESQDVHAYRRHAPTFIQAAYTAFGPRRCLLGSDWPVSGGGPASAEWFALVREVIPPVGWQALAQENAAQAYRLS